MNFMKMVAMLSCVSMFNVSLRAMDFPSLKDRCLQVAKKCFDDTFNLDDLPHEIEKIENSLKDLPEELQQNFIELIEEDLPPQFYAEQSLFIFHKDISPLAIQSIEFNSPYITWCNSSGMFVRNLRLKETYQKDLPKGCEESIRVLKKAPEAPLIAAVSSENIYLYSAPIPLQLLHVLAIANDKILAFSWHKEPSLFVTKDSKITKIAHISSDCLKKPSLDEYNLPNSNSILSLSVSLDNKFLIIGCRNKPSYKFMLDEKTFEEMDCKKVRKIGISQDSSLVAMSKDRKKKRYLNNNRKTRVFFYEKIYDVLGSLVTIKDNCITTVFGNQLRKHNQNGQLLSSYQLPAFDVIPSLKMDSYCLSESRGTFSSQIYFMFPEKLSFGSLEKLIFKCALEKAIKAENVPILDALLMDKNSLGLFYQPQLLTTRINEALERINSEKEKPENENKFSLCSLS